MPLFTLFAGVSVRRFRDGPGFGEKLFIIWWRKTYEAQIHTTQTWDRPQRSPKCSTSGVRKCPSDQQDVLVYVRLRACLNQECVLMEVEPTSLPVYIRVPGQHERHLLDLPHLSTSRVLS